MSLKCTVWELDIHHVLSRFAMHVLTKVGAGLVHAQVLRALWSLGGDEFLEVVKELQKGTKVLQVRF